jgi:hypothetical protein
LCPIFISYYQQILYKFQIIVLGNHPRWQFSLYFSKGFRISTSIPQEISTEG